MKRAKEIWYLCRRYTAKEALDMGLINCVVPQAELESTTLEWCRQILQHSPLALRCLKSALNADCDGQTDEGCPACRGTGYYGRTAMYEVLPVNDKIVRLINQRTDTKEIMKVARLDGMMTLREVAVRKLAQGITTFEEVIRVTSE